MKTTFKTAIAMLLLGMAAPAAAQQIDVAAITCGDAAAMSSDELTMMIAFIDGYTGGEAGDSVLDFDRLARDLDTLAAMCEADASVKLMDAMKDALAAQ